MNCLVTMLFKYKIFKNKNNGREAKYNTIFNNMDHRFVSLDCIFCYSRDILMIMGETLCY